MSKKLWQAIGLEKNHSDLGDFSEYSTIKVEDGGHGAPNDTSQEIRLFSSEPIRNNYFLNRIGKQRSRPEATVKGELDIESCQSQGQNQQSPKFLSNEWSQDELKAKIRRVDGQIKQLRQNQLHVRQSLLDQCADFRSQLAEIIQQLIQQISKKQQQIANNKCVKCESSQKIIAALTKQYWETDRLLQDQIAANSKAERPMPGLSLKEVELGLLEERRQTIIRLQSDLTTQIQENAHLKSSLGSLQHELNCIESEYKQHLLQLKFSTDELNQLANSRYQKLLGEKQQLQRDYEQLKKQFQVLLSEQVQQIKEKRVEPHQKAIQPFNLSRTSLQSSITTYLVDNPQAIIKANSSSRLNFQNFSLSSSELVKSLKNPAQNQSWRYQLALSRAKLREQSRGNAHEIESSLSWRGALESIASLRRQVRKEIRRFRVSES